MIKGDKKSRLKKKGFTFIELITIIAIVSIMTAVTLSLVGQNRPERSVEVVARELAATIREAQNSALSGKQLDSVINAVCGYGIYFDSSADSYSYDFFYSDDATNCVNAPKIYNNAKVVKTSTLKNKVKFQDITTRAAYFTMPHSVVYTNGGALVSGSASIDFVLVSEVDNNEKYTVCVYASGKVEEKVGEPGC